AAMSAAAAGGSRMIGILSGRGWRFAVGRGREEGARERAALLPAIAGGALQVEDILHRAVHTERASRVGIVGEGNSEVGGVGKDANPTGEARAAAFGLCGVG